MPELRQGGSAEVAPPAPNPQARMLLGARPRHKTPMRDQDVAARRAEMRAECSRFGGQPEAVAEMTELRAGGVPARLYRPARGEREVLVWLHGGAYTLGGLDTADVTARALANRAGCAVLSVGYRLAPEHRYPAAVEDAWAATGWALENFEAVAVGGDSAGGNLSAVVAMRARDREIGLALQLLVYPVIDYRPDSRDYEAFSDQYGEFAGISDFGRESREKIRRLWECYVPDPALGRDRDAAPLRASSFSRLCPAVIIAAEHDILLGEGREYASSLQAAGVPVKYLSYQGQVHGFYVLPGVMDDARDAIAHSGAELRRAFELRHAFDGGR
jgi:acetyl esterase